MLLIASVKSRSTREVYHQSVFMEVECPELIVDCG